MQVILSKMIMWEIQFKFSIIFSKSNCAIQLLQRNLGQFYVTRRDFDAVLIGQYTLRHDMDALQNRMNALQLDFDAFRNRVDRMYAQMIEMQHHQVERLLRLDASQSRYIFICNVACTFVIVCIAAIALDLEMNHGSIPSSSNYQ